MVQEHLALAVGMTSSSGRLAATCVTRCTECHCFSAVTLSTRRASDELSDKHRVVWVFAPGGRLVGAAGDDDGLV